MWPMPNRIQWLPAFSAAGISQGDAMGGTGAVTPGLGAGVISSVLEPSNNAATGLVTGEGLLPVPEKLAKKILELEFIEMRELKTPFPPHH